MTAERQARLRLGSRLVDSRAPGFDNPELPYRTGLGEGYNHGVRQDAKSGEQVIWTTEHDDAATGLRGIPKDAREIQIQCHQNPGFGPAMRVQGLVIHTREPLPWSRTVETSYPA